VGVNPPRTTLHPEPAAAYSARTDHRPAGDTRAGHYFEFTNEREGDDALLAVEAENVKFKGQ